MHSARNNFLIDLLTFVIAFLATSTGLLLRWVLPPGSGGMTFWGLRRHDWGDVHFYLICALALVVLLHVALHWSWVCLVACRLAGRTPPAKWAGNLYGVGILTLLVLALGGVVLYSSSRVMLEVDGQHRATGRESENRGRFVRQVAHEGPHE